MVERLRYIANLLIVALLLASVAIQRDGRVAGVDVENLFAQQSLVAQSEVAVETTLDDGTRVINSTSLGGDIIGFGGRTPVKVYVKGGVIERVEAEPNNETPSFFDEVVKSGLFDVWRGLTLDDAAHRGVDIVSGATYTSAAIIGNVQRAAQYGADVEAESKSLLSDVGLKDITGLLVILLGVVLTFFGSKIGSKMGSKYRWLINLQLTLNVAVLGFWCGSFLSLATFTAWVSNGVNISLSLVTFALLCVVVLVPLFGGKRGSYCHLHCPMGSAQELIGRVALPKIKLSSGVNKFLNNLRYYILAVLTL